MDEQTKAYLDSLVKWQVDVAHYVADQFAIASGSAATTSDSGNNGPPPPPPKQPPVIREAE